MARYIPDKVLKNVGRRISEIRVKRGLTQMKLAEKLGISLRWLQQVEGGWDLPLRQLVRIANALDCGLADLFKKATSTPPGRGRPRKTQFRKPSK